MGGRRRVTPAAALTQRGLAGQHNASSHTPQLLCLPTGLGRPGESCEQTHLRLRPRSGQLYVACARVAGCML